MVSLSADCGVVLVWAYLFDYGLKRFFQLHTAAAHTPSAGAMAFLVALVKTGYMLRLIAGTQTIVGALLLLNRFVSLVLVIIAPVVVNICAYHLFLAPAQIYLAIIVAALEIYLAWTCRAAFRPMAAPVGLRQWSVMSVSI